MEIELLCIGKIDKTFWSEALKDYEKKINYYIKFSITYISKIKVSKKISPKKIKEEEAKMFFQKLRSSDEVILLDEKGKNFNSINFAEELEKIINNRKKKLIFLIGGAYGFSDKIYDKFSSQLSLSKMTFSHQMVRLFFCEQLYRAFTIINNHPYHNK